eukprot:scaffold203_cov84-Cylindrotheca_fusiformis.AAC.1
MISIVLKTSLVALLAGFASARNVPSNVQDLYESITSSNCKNKLASGFYSLFNKGPGKLQLNSLIKQASPR